MSYRFGKCALWAGGTEKIRLGSAGQLGISGANYGTSGQVLTSTGSSTGLSWATPSSGVNMVDEWRLSTNLTNGGSEAYITSNWVRNETNNWGGGWPFGGKKDSKTIIDKMKYDPDHPDGTGQLNPHPPGSTLYNIFERHRQYDELDMLGSTGGSQFFAKNVTYDNAYDYLNSPNYGLRTSEVAYNMSMQDEVSQILDSLADPESQVVMNNASVNKNGGDQQIEYSAIAVRGNPLKDGTYISPYAV